MTRYSRVWCIAATWILGFCTASASRAGVVSTASASPQGGQAMAPGNATVTDGVYRLISVSSGNAADVEGGSTSVGANIYQWTYLKTSNQFWRVQKSDSGSYVLTSVNSGLVMDVTGVSTTPGALLHQWGWLNAANQKWWLRPVDGGAFNLVSVNSGLCADVAGASTADGASLLQWTCHGGDNQKWRFDPIDTSGTPTSAAVGQVCFFKGTNFSGDSLCTTPGSRPSLDASWNDTFASARVPAGYDVYLYTDFNYKGTWILIQGDVADLGSRQFGGRASGWAVNWRAGNTPPPAPSAPFGNATMHPEVISLYMIPDLDPIYMAGGNTPPGGCPWGTTQASLNLLHQVLPNAWIRWDNETGHYLDTPQMVETFVTCAQSAQVPMIITASAIDGYNNWWANGNRSPNASITDIANGPYTRFAYQLKQRYSTIRLIETINEPDGPWFVNDGDDVAAFDDYTNRLTAIVGGDTSQIVGPAAASTGSNIYRYWLNRGDLPNVSYHTYGAWQSLGEAAGRPVFVTEYGGFDLNPGAILADIWYAERNSKFSGNLKKLFYHQIFDDGGNRGMFNKNATENNHFAIRDWARALMLYQAVGTVSTHAYFNDAYNDFVASDDTAGKFAALYWNNGAGVASGFERTVENSSLTTSQLNVTIVRPGDSNTAQCAPLAQQPWVSLQNSGRTVTLKILSVDPHAAVLVSTQPCDSLVN